MHQGTKLIETPYDVAVRSRDDRLWLDNHVLAKIPTASFTYAEPQFVYEVRNDRLRGLMEATYVANGPPKENGFLRAGWLPRDTSGVEYDFAFGAGRATS